MTGPNPTDRGRPGSKHHVLVDRHGTPLALILSPANRHDSLLLEPILDAVPPLRARRGRPRRRPGKLHADKAYVHRSCRKTCLRHGIISSSLGEVSISKKLGRHRLVEPILLALHTEENMMVDIFVTAVAEAEGSDNVTALAT